MPEPILTRPDLDRMNCDDPNCDHTTHGGLYLHSRCHPKTPTWAVYDTPTGNLRIRCAECDSHIITIAIAQAPPPTIHIAGAHPEPTYGYEACWARQERGIDPPGRERHCRKPKGHDGPHSYI